MTVFLTHVVVVAHDDYAHFPQIYCYFQYKLVVLFEQKNFLTVAIFIISARIQNPGPLKTVYISAF